jgi:benzoate/toluate 1,2-dioxygenase beta subunit
MSAAADPSRTSHYVTDAFYRALMADFADWQRDELMVTDGKERDGFRLLLEREARLLDRQIYDQWLAMFAGECIYWVPATPSGGDPRREVAVMFDDRRRLEDRVYRLRTGYAWSQIPGSRTSRLIGNVEVFSTAEPNVRMVRSNFLVSEFRDGETRSLAGWCGHRFARTQSDSWQINVKQVNLLECDQSLRNLSIIL